MNPPPRSQRYWSYAQTAYPGDEIELTLAPAGVTVSVTEEQAVDSYNADMTSSILVPFEALSGLIEFLTAALSRGES